MASRSRARSGSAQMKVECLTLPMRGAPSAGDSQCERGGGALAAAAVALAAPGGVALAAAGVAGAVAEGGLAAGAAAAVAAGLAGASPPPGRGAQAARSKAPRGPSPARGRRPMADSLAPVPGALERAAQAPPAVAAVAALHVQAIQPSVRIAPSALSGSGGAMTTSTISASTGIR